MCSSVSFPLTAWGLLLLVSFLGGFLDFVLPLFMGDLVFVMISDFQKPLFFTVFCGSLFLGELSIVF